VVESEDLLAVRRKIAEELAGRGLGPDAFDVAAFEPHVTIGFTKRDLFETDGVGKGKASIVATLPLVSAP
jgi:hypothetical protein